MYAMTPRAQARLDIEDCVESFYNRVRMHMNIEDLVPDTRSAAC